MSSKLLINVNDATPAVVPDTSAPDTGMFSVSHTDGVDFNTSMILPIIGIIVLSVAIIVGIIVAISRRKKVNRFTTHTNKHLIAKLTTLSVVALLGVLGVMNMDKITSMVSATTGTSGDDDTLTITASDIKIDVDLNDKAVFATGESVVTVDSATEAGYTLMAYVDSTTTDLKNETNKSSKSTIAMLDSLEPVALTNNTWGIATTKPISQDSTVFTGLPAAQEEAITLKTTDEATTANDKSTFYYGTYITPDLDYGTYSGTTITYIAIANYAGPCNPNATTIQEAKCLQDFAGPNRDQIVDSMTPETQYTLMDMRDEKTYTIAKLYVEKIDYDGGPKGAAGTIDTNTAFQVWMTQNLDLDLDSNTTYTNEDTDLGYNPDTQKYEPATWTPSLSTYTANDTTWRNSVSTPESYDPGDKFWNGRESDYGDWDDYIQTCDWDSNGPYNCDEAYNPTPHYVSSTGIQQRHMGNYYNWTAAVAMNDSSRYHDGELIEQSICPAGWTLPRVGIGSGSFGSLWYKYTNNYSIPSAIWSEPLYFTASGDWDGSHHSVGFYDGLWSSIVANGDYSRYADFGIGDYTITSDVNKRSYGNSVRCVLRPVSSEWSEMAVPIA